MTDDTEVDWPSEGRMALGEAFRRLREIWQTKDPISISLFPGGKDWPPTIVEAWPG